METKSILNLLMFMATALVLSGVNATTAVVFSESTGRYGVAWNQHGKEAAIKKATEDCLYRGGKDCKPVKVSDTPGYGAVAQTCAGDYCGISIITGRRSAAEAERDAEKDCNAHYGSNDCRAYDRWQEAAMPPAANPATRATPVTQQATAEIPSKAPATGETKHDPKKLLIECNRGDGMSCLVLGLDYKKGNSGVRQDSQKAAAFFKKACDLENPIACFALANAYLDGDGISQDFQKSAQIYKKLCKEHIPNSCETLERVERLIQTQSASTAPASGVSKDAPKDLLIECNGGRGASCLNLGLIYIREKDGRMATQFFEKACLLNEIGGCVSAGTQHIKGHDVRQDTQKASQFFGKACDMLGAEGCFNLGYKYYEDESGRVRDMEIAVLLIQRSCNMGLGFGCYLLGNWFIGGKEVRQDMQKAAQFFDKGCDLNDAKSCFTVALQYGEGQGVRQNKPRSIQLLDKACSLKSADACELRKKLHSTQ